MSCEDRKAQRSARLIGGQRCIERWLKSNVKNSYRHRQVGSESKSTCPMFENSYGVARHRRVMQLGQVSTVERWPGILHQSTATQEFPARTLRKNSLSIESDSRVCRDTRVMVSRRSRRWHHSQSDRITWPNSAMLPRVTPRALLASENFHRKPLRDLVSDRS